jgi:hypothetical protein
MPPKMPNKGQRVARPRGYDPTINIAQAASAKSLVSNQEQIQKETEVNEMQEVQQNPNQEANDDLKKLIETLKSKITSQGNTPQKKGPPTPRAKTVWNRSVLTGENNWAPKPAYTILTRISNHEKVPLKSTRPQEVTINSVPHSFLYKPGVDGIKVDKLTIKAGKQVGIG